MIDGRRLPPALSAWRAEPALPAACTWECRWPVADGNGVGGGQAVHQAEMLEGGELGFLAEWAPPPCPWLAIFDDEVVGSCVKPMLAATFEVNAEASGARAV